MDDIIKPQGSTKASKPDAGGGNIRGVPVFGIVKNNIDPIRAGRIQVYISDLGSNDPDDSAGWVTVSYMSPFFGFVQPKAADTGNGNFVNNPSSYGLWNSPPDIGTTVVCIFINGDPSYGFYIGCVPQPEALYMVPAIGSSEDVITNNDAESNAFAGATRLPVTNINTNNSSIADSPKFIQSPRPVHSYSAAVMTQQGIIKDPIRGPISSSAQRETPSRVGWGVSTPGRPIFEGGYNDKNISEAISGKIPTENLKVISRRGGHSIVMDDGDLIGQDQLIRIRTALGHQILMSDNGQTLLILHSNGQSYIELGKEGTIDLYSTNSVNVRTQGDLNLHADNNINIHASKKMNIFAEEMNIHSDKDTNHKVGGNYSVSTIGTHTHKVSGSMSFKSNGDSSFASSSDTYINGAKINLNTGSSSTSPQSVPPIQQIAHTDTLHDSSKGWVGVPGKLKSVTSRTPAHMPWADAGKGVDVKVNNSAGASLPTSPSPAVTSTNSTAELSGKNQPVTQTTVSTVPDTPATSKAMDAATNGAMVGAVAQAAATGPTAAAVKAGAGVVNTDKGLKAAVGALALSPAQIEQAGYLKPGSAALVNSLIQTGATVESAITPNMFTGRDGINNINDLIKNSSTQVKAFTNVVQKVQTGLTQTGAITGKESPTAIAGLVMAGSTVGISQTVSVLQNANATNTLPATGVPGVTNEINTAIHAGKIAAGVAQIMGGDRAISSAVSSLQSFGAASSALDSSRGAQTAAFLTILASLPPLKTGTPQNLKEIANKSAIARKKSNVNSNALGIVTAAAGLIGGPAATAAIPKVQGAVNAIGAINRSGSLATLGSAVISAANNIKSIAGIYSNTNSSTQLNSMGPLYTPGINPNGRITSTAPVDAATVYSRIKGTTNAITSLKNAKTLETGISAAFSLYRNVSGLVPNSPSVIASGLNTLPGGASLASTTGKAPSSPVLSSLISSSTTAAMVGTSLSTSLVSAAGVVGGKLESVANDLNKTATDMLDKLKSGSTNLTTLAISSLPPDAAASLNSAVSAITNNASASSKTPTVGEDTFDRTSQTSQIKSMLDPKVPAPDFSGPSDDAVTTLQQIEAEYDQLIEKENEYTLAFDKWENLQTEYFSLKDSLPAGDPRIEEAKQRFFYSASELARLNAELLALSEDNNV